jgi:hypothetical protein
MKNVSGRFGARPETLTDERKPELFLPYLGKRDALSDRDHDRLFTANIDRRLYQS